jgi:hypothetical protein
MRPSSAAAKSATDFLPFRVWETPADGRQRVLDEVVEFSIQNISGILCPLALGHIDIDANHPLRPPTVIV